LLSFTATHVPFSAGVLRLGAFQSSFGP